MDIPHCVYSFIHYRILRLVLPFGCCGQCYSEHSVQIICFASVLAYLLSVYPEVELLSYTVILFNFLQNYHTIFCSTCIILYTHQQHTRVPVFPHLCQHLSCFFFFFNNFIYLFLAVLGLRCCAGFCLVVARGRSALQFWCSGFSLR